MKKTLFQGSVTVLIFLSSWIILKQVDWMTLLRIEKTKASLEEKLGEIFFDVFRKSDKEISNEFIDNVIDSLVTKIRTENNFPESHFRIHILDNAEVNAFALPNGHLILNRGLISAAENQEELCGVICHEMAHIENDHVMKKLLKEVGIRMLVSMTTSGGSGTIRETAGMLSSTAYDRNLENEADLRAVDYMMEAGIDAEPFAGFLYRISKSGKQITGLSWVGTHPDAEERAENILDYCRQQNPDDEQVISGTAWKRLKEEAGM